MKTVLVLGGTGAMDYVPRDSERGLRMDAYIKEHNL